jgi:hypothetical protein
MVQANSPYAGADGLLPRLTPKVAKNGGTFQPAAGQLVAQGEGFYALLGHPDDRDQLGALIVAADIDDPSIICIPRECSVVDYDPFANPAREEMDLADLVSVLTNLNNNFKVFALEHVTSLSKGNLQ